MRNTGKAPSTINVTKKLPWEGVKKSVKPITQSEAVVEVIDIDEEFIWDADDMPAIGYQGDIPVGKCVVTTDVEQWIGHIKDAGTHYYAIDVLDSEKVIFYLKEDVRLMTDKDWSEMMPDKLALHVNIPLFHQYLSGWLYIVSRVIHDEAKAIAIACQTLTEKNWEFVYALKAWSNYLNLMDICSVTLKTAGMYCVPEAVMTRVNKAVDCGAKVVSSVRPFYAESRYSELNRRCLVLKFKNWSNFTEAEKEQATVSIGEKLDVDSIDWTGFGKKYDTFWTDTQNLDRYSDLKRQVTKRKKSFKLPDTISSERWTVSIELLCTGVVTSIWGSLAEGVEALEQYWEWYESNLVTGTQAIHKVLKTFVDSELARIASTNEKMGYDYLPLELRTESLKKYVNEAAGKGQLDVMPTPNNVATAMSDLGWRLDKTPFGEMVWMPSVQ